MADLWNVEKACIFEIIPVVENFIRIWQYSELNIPNCHVAEFLDKIMSDKNILLYLPCRPTKNSSERFLFFSDWGNVRTSTFALPVDPLRNSLKQNKGEKTRSYQGQRSL